jgi:TRAP-type C4-dicarboxylate transport system permease small subunit
VEAVSKAGLILLVVAMSIMCLAQVFWRYALGDPLVWSEEASRYAFVWVSYLSGWLAWKHRRHIALDLVRRVSSPRMNFWGDRLVEAIILCFCLYTFWHNLTLLALTVRQPSAVLNIPMVYVYGAYSVMVALIALDILGTWFSPQQVEEEEQA